LKAEAYSVRTSLHIDADKCTGCMRCAEVCPTYAIRERSGKAKIEAPSCIYCFGCVLVCPYRAIEVRVEAVSLGECDVPSERAQSSRAIK